MDILLREVLVHKRELSEKIKHNKKELFKINEAINSEEESGELIALRKEWMDAQQGHIENRMKLSARKIAEEFEIDVKVVRAASDLMAVY